MAEQNLAKLSDGGKKKNHLSAQNKPDKSQPKGWVEDAKGSSATDF